ncbi:hypothetical protein RAS12_19965 [Achromobacter seleniivolatilans]|uniref:Uncharacterized protein n=1 Tax=Achromobacter seleniivolatilans TaxID=3047478 RepID=A0ABY9LYZ9_9BURK|nr:hypothetical protein [Achromobacter sp. R39]WMD18887.1 hypothetical protein RAS12_19965 [Achromobacter sp. R39]
MPELDLPRLPLTLDYDGALEAQLFDDIRLAVAPHLPAARIEAPRDLASDSERRAAGDYAIWNTVHDLFITQVAAHAIAGIFKDDTAFQFALARQLGDDAAHAEFSLGRAAVLLGSDPLPEVERGVQEAWDLIGGFALRNWQNFLAWQFHYEHYILARLFVNRRTAKVLDFGHREFGENRILPDEEAHRIRITQWWLRKLEHADPAEREDWTDGLIQADEDAQRILGPYLRDSWQLNYRATGLDTRNHIELYDTWRRELLATLLRRDPHDLPALTSLAA